MNCANCGRPNKTSARFCVDCGRPLAGGCPRCGAEVEDHARFCASCGADLAASPAPVVETRKVVTVVFADLAGSTALHERLDAESARRVMERYYAVLRAAVEAHDGTVVKLMGDGVMAAFGVPHVREDDALRAVRCAVAMQETFRDLAAELAARVGPLGLRVAVNSGEVVVRDDDSDVVGDPVNVAARLQQDATDGQVLIGEPTRRLVGTLVSLEPLGELSLRGRAESVRAYRVVSLDRPAVTRATTFVGRDEELRRVIARFDAAVARPGAEMVVVLGSPGLGKSRLIAEVAARVGAQATVVAVRVEAGGATFAPLADGLRTIAEIDDSASDDAMRRAVAALFPADVPERERAIGGVVALLGGAPPLPEETFWAVRRLLGALGADRPVVLVLDDMHWAEPLLLDLAEHLVEWTTDVALLVLVAARPELRDLRSALATPGRLVGDVIALEGLDASAAARLAADVVGTEELPAGVAGHVLATSEGNPLFLGELVRMLVDDGSVRREGERWVAAVDLADVELPPTINALLSARIERLRPDERIVLERAAVVGRYFSRAAVAELVPPDLRIDLDARLESLRRSELIEPDAGWFLGEPVLRFHHVLIREAAYQRLLKETRAELHARFADWLGARVGDDIEHDETLGLHLEQAHQCRIELDLTDDATRTLGERAAAHLTAAGRRALARDDVPAAANLLGRALRRLNTDDPARADLALDWCEALLASGDVDHATRALDELDRWTLGPERPRRAGIDESTRLQAWRACFAGQLAVLTDPQALLATVDAVAAAAADLAQAGDDAGEAKANFVHALALGSLGQVGAAEAALDRALVAARRVGDWRRANAVLAGVPGAALWGPSPVTRASGRCLDVVRVLRITAGSPAVEAVALRCQAVLEVLRGRTDAGRKMLARSRRAVEELGLTHRVLQADMFAGIVELYDGEVDAAERALRAAYEGLRDRGLGTDAAQAAALLARALLGQGHVEDAEALSHESEALAGDDLKAAIAWRGVRAEALAGRGEHAAALEFARAAVDIAAKTDALLDHADARVALAVALRAAGRVAEADAEVARAVELWEAKGATVLVERAGAAPRSTPESPGAAPTPAAVTRRVRTNAATAHAAHVDAAFAARDFDAFQDLLADEITAVHHPTSTVWGREGGLANWRSLMSARGGTYRQEPIATLGETLALCRRVGSIEEGPLDDEEAAIGATRWDDFLVTEVDAHGRQIRVEMFAGDHLADAIVRLYECFAELLPGGPERDRVAVTAQSIATLLGRQSVDDVFAARHDALLLTYNISETDRASGGDFERGGLGLLRFGASGLVTNEERFDGERLDDALARFDELTASAARPRFENRALRVVDETARRVGGDWDALVALYAPDHVFEDRRSLQHTKLAGEAFFAQLRIMRNAATRNERTVLATRGERLALVHDLFSAVDRHGGEAEWPLLDVIEIDDAGLRTASVTFDLDELGAAYEELDARYAAGEGAPYAEFLGNLRAWQDAVSAADLDRDAIFRLLTDDFTIVNHRLVHVMGPRRASRDEWLATLTFQAMNDLRAHTMRLDHMVRLSRRGGVAVMTLLGLFDGGDWESTWVGLFRHDGRRLQSLEWFDLDRLDAALARYDELANDGPLRIPPNAAIRARERVTAARDAGDWEALRALAAEGFVYDDRGWSHIVGDLDMWIASHQQASGPGVHLHREDLAVFGDRIAVHRFMWRGDPDEHPNPFEMAEITLTEVDAAGRIVASVNFDPSDLRAALVEGFDRFIAGEAAAYAHAVAPVRDVGRALAARDWDALADLCTDDLAVRDRRTLGVLVPSQGPAEWIASQQEMVALTADLAREWLRVLAWDHHGLVAMIRSSGTVPDGGPFEIVVIAVYHTRDGRLAGYEMFDVDDEDRALVRFEELRREPTAVFPPTAASRARDRTSAAFSARDWHVYRSLASPDFRWEDRTKAAHLEGDVELWIASARELAQAPNLGVDGQLIGSFGDRIVLGSGHWSGGAAGSPFEFDIVRLFEVDADGLLCRLIRFDPEDRAAAFAEAYRLFAQGEGAEYEHSGTAVMALARASVGRDWDALRRSLSDDFALSDHRAIAIIPTQGRDEWIESLRVLSDLAPDWSSEIFRIVRWAHHGRVVLVRTFGTLHDGGPFENVFVSVLETLGGRVTRYELYDVADLDRALARFAELRPTETP